MTGRGWPVDELSLLGRTGEIAISSRRADGSDSPWWPIWVVRVGDDVYVRSTDGPDKIWFRNALRRRRGRIRAGDTVIESVFVDHQDGPQENITAAYRAKYRASSPWSLNRASTSTSTIKVLPAP
ncbi:MAG: DUF2255 family protein [Deltaproteobacteria bacterium]|nr:DUF2255 family protein [Deltaproteobacteria bacterium]